MKKYLIFLFILFSFCSKTNIDIEYEDLRNNLKNLKDNAQKSEEIKKFLNRFPDSEYTYDLSLELIDYDEPEKAEVFIINLIGKIKDNIIKDDLRFNLLELYKRTKNKEKILKTFNEFNKPLKYYNYSETTDALINAEAYDEALGLLDEMKEFCKREYIDKDYQKSSEEQKNRTFKNRNFRLEFLKGKAYFGLGKYEESLNSFNKAKEFVKPSFVGTYLFNFNFHFSLLLKNMGKKEEAISNILPDVIFERNDENYKLFEDLYFELYGTKDGIEDFLKNKKMEISPLGFDFKLKDYEGNERSFFELSNGKITLLAFWFPT